MTEERTLLVNLVLRGGVTTTAKRAKALSRSADRLLHLARNPQSLRRITSELDHRFAAKHLIREIVPRLKRPTVTKVKMGFRSGDGAPLIRISLDLTPVSGKATSPKNHEPAAHP